MMQQQGWAGLGVSPQPRPRPCQTDDNLLALTTNEHWVLSTKQYHNIAIGLAIINSKVIDNIISIIKMDCVRFMVRIPTEIAVAILLGQKLTLSQPCTDDLGKMMQKEYLCMPPPLLYTKHSC